MWTSDVKMWTIERAKCLGAHNLLPDLAPSHMWLLTGSDLGKTFLLSGVHLLFLSREPASSLALAP